MAQYIGNTPSSTLLQVRRQTYTFTATSNQTVFSGTDGYSNVLATPNAAQVLIYIDGILLEPHQYSVGLDFVTLNTGVTAGSEVVIFTELEAALINTYTIAETNSAITTATNNIPLEQITNVDLETNGQQIGQTIIWDGSNFIPGDLFSQDDFNSAFASKYTTDLAEGSNLYYTDARVGEYLTSNSYATETFVSTSISTAVSNLIDTAPATLDTLNEIAAALGDDPNFATTITASIGTKLATADFTSTADTWLTTKTTSDLTEGTNLYYTDARAQAAISTDATLSYSNGVVSMPLSGVTAGSYGSASTVPVITVDAQGRITSASTTNVAGVSGFSYTPLTNTYTITTSAGTSFDATGDLTSFDTGDLTEGTNLYYTDARVGTYIGTITTNALTEGINNLYYTDIRVGTYIGTITTNALTEGSNNLYYTDVRVSDYLANNGYDSDIAAKLNTADFTSTANTWLITKNTNSLSEGSNNLYYTDTRVGNYLTNNGYDTAANIVASIVDTAPATLDTLNELAAALGDDPNFATTISNSIGLKANTADLGTAAAQDVGYFATAAQGTLADSALQSVAFADLTSTPTTISGYGITDAFDGAYSSLTGTPTTLAGYGITDAPASLTDLGITDGTVGQILTTDGAGGFIFEDAAEPLVVSGTAPASPTEGALWFDNVTTGQLYAYVGNSWLSTAGITTLEFSSVGDLSDVDITSAAPSNGQALVWDNANSKFVPGDVGADFTGYATETFVASAISTASSDYATAAQGALADSALQSVAFADLTSTPTTLAGYGITDSFFDGAYGSLSGTPTLGTASAQDVGYFATAAQGALADSALQSADLTGYATETFVTNAIATKDNTDEITEGSTNLYYTDARVEAKIDAYVTGGTGVTVTSGSIAIGQSVATSADVTFNDVTATGDLVVDGDLTVNGTTTSINVSQLEVTDNIIHVADGNESSDLVDFGWVGHYYDGAASSHAGVVRDATDSKFKIVGAYTKDELTGTTVDFAHAGTSLGILVADTFEGNLTGDVTGTVSSLSNLSTSDLSEGTNEYYTDAKVGTYLTNNAYATETFVGTAISTASSNYATSAQGALADSALQSVAFADLTTTPTTIAGYGITDAFDGAYGSLSGAPTIPSVITDLGIVDGTAGQVLTTNGSGVYTFSDTAVAYGDSDVATYLSSNDYATSTSIIATITDSAPGTLDTLNELAAALGDDANFSTTVTNSIALKANSADLGTAAAQDVGYFATAAQGALADSALQSVAFADLGITDGTVGQVLVTDGAGVYTFEDAANPTTVSGTAPASPNEGDLWFDNVTTGQLYTYVGSSWLSTAGITTLEFSSVGDLSDVDITSAAPTAGQALVWDNANSKFVPGDVGADFSGYATEAFVGTAISTASSDYATAAQGALADSALQSVTFTDLTTTPTTLAGYGITDAFDGAYGSLSGAPTLGTASAQDVGYFATAAQGALADSSIQSLSGYATETYVNTAVSNLVDAAPGTLDTLNELAAALGDDANFATTTANAIGLKANSADLGTAAAQDVGYFATAAQGALADSALQSADLTGYATETFVGTAISTASADYATAAQGALADSALQSVAFADLTSTPTTLAGYGITDSFFDGAYSSLTGAPTIPSALTDLGITDGTVGQVLTTDGAGSFTFADAGGSGGSGVTVSGTAPSSPSEGDLWFDDTTTGLLYVYENGSWTSTTIPPSSNSIGDLSDVDITTTAPTDGQSLIWDNANSKFVPGDVASGGGGGGSSITTSETAPVSPTAGDMWFNSATLALYLYYADGDSTQWIQINDAGGAAGNGLVLISSTPPANPASGDLWYDDASTGSLLIYNGSVWVSTADGGGGSDQSTYWVETSTTYDAIAGSKLFVDTSSSTVQVNLPASPVMGDEVYVVDAAGNSGTYNITINRNGKKITGLDEDFTIDVNGAAIILAYYNATRGWIVISK